MKKEIELETRLIKCLEEMKYTYRKDIKNREQLQANFKERFEELNHIQLTDYELKTLLGDIVSSDIFTVSKKLRSKGHLEREDGTDFYYQLINFHEWCKNSFEIIDQLTMNAQTSHHRYDVILLINGLPLVQIELKNQEINPKKALEQIMRYKNTVGNGYTNSIMCFMQIFIVSNGNMTHYFSNNNSEHFHFDINEKFLPVYHWADKDNKKIHAMTEFAQTFLDKCTLAEMILRYMVLVETEKKILMMRPYQIYAVKHIIASIKEHAGNGYIWHTTGSGKTLTSFKASTLLKDNPNIDKCLFVVDRKDLDKQTRDEFNKFQEGSVEENTNTQSLIHKMLSDNYKDKVIVTTIQKLGLALKDNQQYKNQLTKIKDKRMVFIFDECHRSQFGENHQSIRNFFQKSQMFGFTGTPIFTENATKILIKGNEKTEYTTKDLFEHELHTYTITHAMNDENVLNFRVDHYQAEETENHSKAAIVRTILKIHNTQTLDTRFNALLATNSISDAIAYYHLFERQQKERQAQDPGYQALHIACVFSPPSYVSADAKQMQEDLLQEKEDYQTDPEGKAIALRAMIQKYNEQFGTNHKIEDFDKYYQDVQKRIKDQQYLGKGFSHKDKIDITIVVDMLLTGFDSKYLNTLYVDKNLRYHGLIQAFSRTNRVLNSSKPYGNIIDFYGLQDPVQEAMKLFSGISGNTQNVWIVEDYQKAKSRLIEKVQEFNAMFTSQGLSATPDQVQNLKGKAAKIEFLNHFKEIQKLMLFIPGYKGASKEEIEEIFSDDSFKGFRTVYLDIGKNLKDADYPPSVEETTEETMPDVPAEDPIPEFDMEYVLFDSVLIDYDYIMKLISEVTYRNSGVDKKEIEDLLSSNAKFMEEKEFIRAFMNTLQSGDEKTPAEITEAYQRFKESAIMEEFQQIAQKQGIEWEDLEHVIDKVNRLGQIDKVQDFEPIFEKLNLHWKEKEPKRVSLLRDLCPLFEKYMPGDIKACQGWQEW